MNKFPDVIDNSMRKELVKCEMSAHYKYEMGLRANEGSGKVDLHAGKAYSSALEVARKAYYINGVKNYIDEGIRELYRAYGNFIPEPKSNKTADRMAGAVAHYFENYPLEADTLKPILFPNGDWGIEVQAQHELPIAHPYTGKPLLLVGRFDMLAIDPQSDVWVVDEKTTSQMGDKWMNQWLLDSQVSTYCFLARMLLEQHGINLEVKGAVINGMAIRLRDYETRRIPVYRSDWMIERWYRQFREDIIRWIDAYKTQLHNQVFDHACAQYNNPCEYAPLCLHRNPERIIETSFSIKRWNPVTREEENE